MDAINIVHICITGLTSAGMFWLGYRTLRNKEKRDETDRLTSHIVADEMKHQIIDNRMDNFCGALRKIENKLGVLEERIYNEKDLLDKIETKVDHILEKI